MSRRLFSEFLDEITSAPVHAPQDKRRKTDLNSRFDRMVQTMNLTHRSPVKKPPRRRAGSTSSTSGSSVPRTPIDRYDQYHHDGRLGEGFSVLKVAKKGVNKKSFPWEESQSSSDDLTSPLPPPAPLPTWLADTFSTLNTKHPLRLLLPTRNTPEPAPATTQIREGLNENDEEDRFSFSIDPSLRIDTLPEHDYTERDSSSPNDLLPDQDNAEPSTQSTQTAASQVKFYNRTPSLPKDSCDFLPFSMPGPASTISRSVVSAPRSVHSLELESDAKQHPDAPSPGPQSQLTDYEDQENNTTILNRASNYLVRPSHFSLQPIHAAHETVLYNDSKESALIPDPPTNHKAYIDVFSTPGPAYPAPPPVYFDSPTEDPESDPPQAGYKLDSLDFRWEPFIHRAADESLPKSPATVAHSDDHYYEVKVEPEGEDDEDGQLYMKINLDPVPSPSCEPFSFTPPQDDVVVAAEEIPKTPERPPLPFFAPAPGIYISPLRDGGATESLDSAQAIEGSEASNDSIEDWDDE